MPRRESFEDLVNRLAPDETWEEFADRSKVTSRTIWNLRFGRGKRSPTMGTLTLLANALGVDIGSVQAAIEVSRKTAADD